MTTIDKYGSNLIFIISIPRSGSTMFQRIIAGHPDVFTSPETWLMLHPVYALKNKGIISEYNTQLARKALSDFLSQCGGEDTYFDALREMASVLYSRALENSDKKYFLEKTPRYYHIIPELYRIFPKAKYLFLFRNPLAVLSSVLKTRHNNRPDLLMKAHTRIDMFRGPRLIINGMKLLGDDAIPVYFEKLVSKPEKTIRDVCKKMSLEYDDRMIDYGKTEYPTSIFGDQTEVLKQTRPVTDTVEKWKSNLNNPGLIDFARKYLNTLGENVITNYGYDFNELMQELDSISQG